MSVLETLRKVPVVGENAKIIDVIELIANTDADVVVVVSSSGNSIRGIVTPKDVVKAIARGIGLDSPVAKIANNKFVLVSARSGIWSVIKIFQESGSEFAIVVSESGEIEGVITLKDLIRVNSLVGMILSVMPHFRYNGYASDVELGRSKV